MSVENYFNRICPFEMQQPVSIQVPKVSAILVL